MARHSHFHNIQLTKGKADAKRAKTFVKHVKSITAAAKEGGGDAAFNVSLRVAVDAARSANMPKENIDRAIARGIGNTDGGEQIVEVIYEGFGPGGIAFLVVCLTDNRNRSITEVRTTIQKNGGNIAGQGSVAWMFEKKGVIVIEDTTLIKDRDGFELAVIDAGAEDFEEREGMIQIVTPVSTFKAVFDAIDKLGIKPDSGSLAYLAKESVEINDGDAELMQSLVSKLEALDDVDTVYTNQR